MRIVVLVLAFASSAANATCAPIRYSASEIAAWEIVVAGDVAETGFPQREAADVPVGAHAVLAPEERLVRVAVDAAFRGETAGVVDATPYPCAGSGPEAGDRVVVYGTSTGVLYTAPAAELEAGLRELFAEPER